MSVKFAIFLAVICFVSVVKTNDIRLGYVSPQSRKIYSAIKEADPALWTRIDDVIINAPRDETISAVFVTDLRDDKAGQAIIESGGIGDKSVTVGLRSPSILRGYKFEIEVYGNDPNMRYYSKGGFSQYNDDSQYARKY